MNQRIPGTRAGRLLGGLLLCAAIGLGFWGARANAAPRALELVLALHSDAQGLERLAAGVSDPASPLYGHYETVTQLARRFGATRHAERRVLGWLVARGARDIHLDATGLFVDATLTERLAGRLFSGSARDARLATTRAPVIPAELRRVVTSVLGLDSRPLLTDATTLLTPRAGEPYARAAASSALPRTGTPAGCAAGRQAGAAGGDPRTAGFTPNQYLTAYGYDPLHRAAILGQGERVALLEVDGVDRSDVSAFARCFGLHVAPIVVHRVGLRRNPRPREETTLDLEVLDAAAPRLKAIDVYEIHNDLGALLRALTAPIQHRADHPAAISISLGACEEQFGSALNGGAIRAAAEALAADTASGVTVLSATGDFGSSACAKASGVPLHQLGVNFPASSPYVLAVGGTNLELTATNRIKREVVWNDAPYSAGAGGGGFSEIYESPPWQQRVIPRDQHALHSSRGPIPLRAVPDVAMLADGFPGYAVYCSAGCVGGASPWKHVGGTSAATPLLAGGLALLDEGQRLDHRPALGNAQDLIGVLATYSELFNTRRTRQAMLNDVASGDNDVGRYLPGGRGRSLGCCRARRGYDEASGWGSLDLTGLGNVALSVLPDTRLRIGVGFPAQHPLRTGSLSWVVGCTTSCFLYPEIILTISGRESFSATGSSFFMAHRDQTEFSYRFTRRQLSRLRVAAGRHRRIAAIALANIFYPTYGLRLGEELRAGSGEFVLSR